MLVGLLGKEPGVAPKQSKRYGLRIVEPVLESMEVEHRLVEVNRDIEKIGPAIEFAYGKQAPVVLLVGASPK